MPPHIVNMKSEDFTFLMMNLLAHDPIHDFNLNRLKLHNNNELLTIIDIIITTIQNVSHKKQKTSAFGKSKRKKKTKKKQQGGKISYSENYPLIKNRDKSSPKRTSTRRGKSSPKRTSTRRDKSLPERISSPKRTSTRRGKSLPKRISSKKYNVIDKIINNVILKIPFSIFKNNDRDILEDTITSILLYNIGFITNEEIESIRNKSANPMLCKLSIMEHAIKAYKETHVLSKHQSGGVNSGSDVPVLIPTVPTVPAAPAIPAPVVTVAQVAPAFLDQNNIKYLDIDPASECSNLTSSSPNWIEFSEKIHSLQNILYEIREQKVFKLYPPNNKKIPLNLIEYLKIIQTVTGRPGQAMHYWDTLMTENNDIITLMNTFITEYESLFNYIINTTVDGVASDYNMEEKINIKKLFTNFKNKDNQINYPSYYENIRANISLTDYVVFSSNNISFPISLDKCTDLNTTQKNLNNIFKRQGFCGDTIHPLDPAQKERANEILKLFVNVGKSIKGTLVSVSAVYANKQDVILDNILTIFKKSISQISIGSHDDDIYNFVKQNLNKQNLNIKTISHNEKLSINKFILDSKDRYIINNGVVHDRNKQNPNIYDNTIGSICSIVDACGKGHGGTDITHPDKEMGTVHVRFVNSSNSSQYYDIKLEKQKLPGKKYNLNIDMNINGIISKCNDDISLESKRDLSVATRYSKVLDNILSKLTTSNFKWEDLDDEFINKQFIPAYHPKSSGDFLQELTAVIKHGGFEEIAMNPRYEKQTNIKKFDDNGDSFRVYTANDKPSAVRYWFLRSLINPEHPHGPHPKINTNSCGGFINENTSKGVTHTTYTLYKMPPTPMLVQ